MRAAIRSLPTAVPYRGSFWLLCAGLLLSVAFIASGCNRRSAPTVQDYVTQLASEDLAERREAARVLSQVHLTPEPVLEPFGQILKNETDEQTKLYVVQAVANLRDRAAPLLPELIGLLKSSEQDDLTYAILRTLGNMGKSARTATDEVIPLAKSRSWVEPSFATLAASLPESQRASFVTAATPIREKLLQPHFAALDTLAKISGGSSAALNAFTEFLQYKNPATLKATCVALGFLGVEARPAGAALINLLNNPDNEVRRYAAWAVGQAKLKAATGSLIPLLDDPIDVVRHNSAIALEEIGTQMAKQALHKRVSALTPQLHSKDWDARRIAARELAVINTEEAITALKEHKRFFPNTVVHFKDLPQG